MPLDSPDLIDLDRDDAERVLAAHFAARGQPSYRVRQVMAWLYERDAMGVAEMTDLSSAEREAMAASFRLTAPAAADVALAADGTVKHLWRMADGELLESVLIPARRVKRSAEYPPTLDPPYVAPLVGGEARQRERLTLCISSQAGCALACTFCATGWSGYRRQLTAGEIVAQFRGARRWAAENDAGTITNIVFMGMGEPLANRKAVMPALTLLNRAYGMGARRITVSTVGVVPGILELAARPEQFRLAVSLHAPNHELRAKLIPLEKKYPLADLLDALRRFEAAGGRRITFEYVMINGINDDVLLARELAGLVHEFRAHVNLIPFNPIPGNDWRPSSSGRLRVFAQVLEENDVNATVREPRGRDIAAACGQLRAQHATRPPRPFIALIANDKKRVRASAGAECGPKAG